MKYEFEIKAITDNIIYNRFSGIIDYDSSIPLISKTKDFIKNKNEFVLIQDIKDLKYNTLKSRIAYMRAFKNNHKVIAVIMIGASELQRLRVKTVSMYLVPFPIILVDNYEDAILKSKEILRKKKKGELLVTNLKKKNNSIIEKYKNSYKDNYLVYKLFRNLYKKEITYLYNYLLNIDWESKNDTEEEKLTDHPFSLIFRSFMVIIVDIKELLFNFKEKEKELINIKKILQKRTVFLEDRIKKRTKELEEINLSLRKELLIKELNKKKLNDSRKIKVKENNTKSVFLANISVKIKSLVDDLLVQIENSKTKKNKEELTYELKKIIKMSENLFVEVKDLITHSQIEIGKIEYKFSKYNFSYIVNLAIFETKALSLNKKIKINFIDKKDIYVLCDKDKINEVVRNLLINAIKHSPINSEIIIKIVEFNDKIKFMIIDSGKGIDNKEIMSIFRSFGNIKLVISKKIITAHKGDIWALNNQDKGATFIFTLPKVEKSVFNNEQISSFFK